MSNVTKISVDVMGGENAPFAPLAAIRELCGVSDSVYFYICGDREVIAPYMEEHLVDQSLYEIVHSDDVVKEDEKPVTAFKTGKNTSMYQGIMLVKERKADAFVSSGNTGALMIMSKMILGCIDGIRRPAIIGTMPTIRGKSVMLDIGANSDCNETHLLQFTLMAICFSKIVLGKDNPSVAVLNIGSEKYKGRDLERRTAELLQKSQVDFAGYIEANGILSGDVDVIVTDGFTGNIALKAIEGAVQTVITFLKNAAKRSIFSRVLLLLLSRVLKSSIAAISPSKNNGAIFIGIDGIVVKSHGNSKDCGIRNAIELAHRLSVENVNARIVKSLQLSEDGDNDGLANNFIKKLKETSAKIFTT